MGSVIVTEAVYCHLPSVVSDGIQLDTKTMYVNELMPRRNTNIVKVFDGRLPNWIIWRISNG